jgi:hypothetical protein
MLSPGLGRLCRLGLVLGALGVAARPAAADPVIAPEFAGSYTLGSLGSVPGLPAPYGGLTFLAGNPNVLLIGGDANTAAGAIYSVPVVRDASGHITGFGGSATLFAAAPNIDGGLTYAPNGTLLFTGYPVNTLGQLLPGSTTPDKTLNLGGLGVASSVGSLAIVPGGFPGAGEARLVSWSGGQFYSADLSPDGSGTFDLTNVNQITTLVGGPEGIAFVPQGSPLFSGFNMLVSEWSAGNVAVYELDANGNPINRRDFVTGLTGAEGALIDPLTGDFLFSTFGGGDQLIVVRGFAAPSPAQIPEPPSLAVFGGLAALGFALRRRLRKTA